MNTKPKFIVLDGMDGSGKGTQLKLLREYFEANNIPHYFTREPGGSPDAEKIRERVLSDASLSTQERFDLMWESRALHINQTVLPALGVGKIVVSDRFDSSTWAYQICGEENAQLIEPFKVLRARLITKACPPDLYVFFDLDPSVSRSRVMDANKPDQNFLDTKPLDFYIRVRAGFKEFASRHNAILVQANQTPEKVLEEMLQGLKEKGIV